ncbi:hypothetical protein YC2023_025439 [Brassica napus]
MKIHALQLSGVHLGGLGFFDDGIGVKVVKHHLFSPVRAIALSPSNIKKIENSVFKRTKYHKIYNNKVGYALSSLSHISTQGWANNMLPVMCVYAAYKKKYFWFSWNYGDVSNLVFRKAWNKTQM